MNKEHEDGWELAGSSGPDHAATSWGIYRDGFLRYDIIPAEAQRAEPGDIPDDQQAEKSAQYVVNCLRAMDMLPEPQVETIARWGLNDIVRRESRKMLSFIEQALILARCIESEDWEWASREEMHTALLSIARHLLDQHEALQEGEA